jgi:hypothetical protein
MSHSILVRDVHDFNNTSGKKFLTVTSLEDDELIKSQFSMSMAYMFPDQKLFLSTVSPEDTVSVILNTSSFNPLLVGEFTDIISENDIHSREPMCKCISPLMTDGFDIYCTNQQCGLTLYSRFSNLANTSMFSRDSLSDIANYIPPGEDPYMVVNDNPDLDKPFSLLMDPRFWNTGGKSIEDFLLNKTKTPFIDLSTFLIESEFSSFLDSFVNNYSQNSYAFRNLRRFYDDMNELVQRRDDTSRRQNKLIVQFINSLGISSLSPEIVSQLLQYERCLGYTQDPLMSYFYMMTHPNQMINELGIHKLEAEAIYREVYSRKYELYDICLAYTNHETAESCFDKMKL